MNKLKAFVLLDFVTMKPYLTVKNLLIYVIVALFLSIMSGSAASGVGIAVAMASMFTGYPFALGEKSGMDILYTTLSLSRKTVVSGRYLFALVLNLCTIILSYVIAMIGILVTRISSFTEQAFETLLVSFVLFTMFIVIQAVQLPLYFKFGYSKAKFFIMIPFVAVMAFFAAFTSSMGRSRDSEFFNQIFGFLKTLSNGLFIVCVVSAVILVVFVSYRLSLSFYKKREF